MRTDGCSAAGHLRCFDLLQDELSFYVDTLPLAHPSWPLDVALIYMDLRTHIFDESVSVDATRRRLGLLDNNICSRFAFFVGTGIKQFLVSHRMAIAARVLEDKRFIDVPITQVSLAVGYGGGSAFTTAFRKRYGCTPDVYRRNRRNN